MDTTLASPLTREGVSRERGGTFAGPVAEKNTYPELLSSRRCKLVVLGLEVGGRWSEETTSFIKLLAQHEARQAPALLQHSLTTALIARWSALLTHAAQQAFAASLIETPQSLADHTNTEGNEPPFSQLAEAPPPPPPPAGCPHTKPLLPQRVWIFTPPKHIWRLASINTVSSELALDLPRKKVRPKKNTDWRIQWLLHDGPQQKKTIRSQSTSQSEGPPPNREGISFLILFSLLLTASLAFLLFGACVAFPCFVLFPSFFSFFRLSFAGIRTKKKDQQKIGSIQKIKAKQPSALPILDLHGPAFNSYHYPCYCQCLHHSDNPTTSLTTVLATPCNTTTIIFFLHVELGETIAT